MLDVMLSRNTFLFELARILILAFGLALVAGTAHAQDRAAEEEMDEEDDEETEAPKKTKTKRSAKKRRVKAEASDNAVVDDSSEANRQNKVASVIGEVGFGVGALPTMGLAGGYYLTPNSLVELSYVSGSLDFLFIKIEGSLASLRWKQWWGNSFYTNLGLAQRTVSFDASLEPLIGTDEISSSLEVSSIGADIQIGNRWQFENFTIGCDWIGYFLPFSSSGETEVNVSGADPDDIDDLQDTADSIGKSGSSQLLRFYIGASF